MTPFLVSFEAHLHPGLNSSESITKSRMARSKLEVRELLGDLLHEIAGIPREPIEDSWTIDGDLQMESVAFVELQVAIEDELNIRLDPIQIVELNRFDAIVDYVYQTAVEAAA